MASKLEMTQRSEGAVLIITLSGSLDGHTFIDFEALLKNVLTDSLTQLVVDLEAVSYIASSGIGCLISSHQHLSGKGGSLHLVNPSPMVREVFQILGIEGLLPIHPDLATALAAAG